MNTLLTIILGAIGILATVVVTWYFTKKQTRNKEITHFSKSSYDIGKGLSDVFPEFQLQYNGNKIVGDVKVLKGGFLNTGNKGIDGLDEKPIQLILPEGCEVKASKASSVSDDFEVISIIRDSRIVDFIISDGVLKKYDFFEYTAIVETSRQIKSLRDELKIGPRKADLDYKYIFLGREEKSFLKSPVFRVLLPIITIITLIPIIAYLYLPKPIQHRIVEKKTNKEVSLFVDRDSTIYLVDAGHELKLFSNKTITKDQLINDFELLPQIGYGEQEMPSIYNWIIGVFVILMLVTYSLFAGYILFWRRERRLNRTLHDKKKQKNKKNKDE